MYFIFICRSTSFLMIEVLFGALKYKFYYKKWLEF